MTPVVAPDVSEYQPPVDDSFNRDFLIFRACFGGNYVDRNAKHNLAWAVDARARGRLVKAGFAVYVVFQPGQNAGILQSLDNLGVPADCVIEVDAEAWSGTSYAINGDHSSEINDLADRLRTRQGGRSDLVWAYGNRGPDLTVWPRKPDWIGWNVASYGGSKPDVPNLIGWQYTDGQPAWDSSNPSSTPPFGRCDHNLLYAIPEIDMPLTEADAVTIWSHQLSDGTTNQPAAAWLRQAQREAAAANAKADALEAEVKSLQAQVAKIQTAGVDPVALAQAIAAHVGLAAK